MFEREQGVAPSSPRRADNFEVDAGPARAPVQVVEAKFTEARETLKAITAVGILKLAAAQPFTRDRRSPRQRRTEYDLAKEGIESQFKSTETAKTAAIAHAKRHGVDTTALVKELDEAVTKAKEQLEDAPTAPPGFQRVPGEDAILAAIRMPPGRERNTELLFLVSELDRGSARALRGRLDATEPDPEDELALAFKRVVDVRADVLSILAGTKQVRIDGRTFRPAEKVIAPVAPATDPRNAPAEATVEHGATPAAAVAERGDVRRRSTGAALPVQRKAKPGGAPPPDAAASKGLQGGGGPLPHLVTIQRSFGRHDVMDVRAHQGPATQQAAADLGAEAYASGRDVGFAATPDLRTASHEAAHVVQQRFGVQLMGGIDGGADDPYERHADQVAEEVVAGRSAEALLDRMAGSGSADRGAVQRSPASHAGAAHAHEDDRVPARGDYFVERTADGSYVFVFNTFDRHAWAEPVFTGLRYYLQQVFPGAADGVIRSVFTDLKVRFDGHDARTLPDDKRYELRIDGKLHRSVIAWMAAHHPGLAPHEPKQGGAGLHASDGGANASHHAAHSGQSQKTAPHATTMTAEGGGAGAHPADKVSAEVEHARALYERLRKAFPDATELASHSTWPEFLAYVSDHAAELQKLLHDRGRAANPEDLRKLLAQFRAHQDIKDGDSGGDVDGHASGKLAGSEAGTRDGAVRTAQDGGIKDGSIHGEPGGDAHGWHRWIPKGRLLLQPTQPTYVVGSSVQAELAWDLSVHPEAGQILLPNHCTYAWTVHGGGKLIDSGGRSVLADDRRADLRLGKEPGIYAIEVTATSKHFRADRHRFASRVAVRAISEQAFDRAAFDQTQLGGPDAAFSRDAQGALHLRPGQTGRTTQDEIGSLDLARGGIDALAAQGKLTASDHDVAVGQIDKQRAALLEIQAKVGGGTPYVVRGTFVSREDSSTTPLRLMMHVIRRGESEGVARYELVLHDTTFGEAIQHPGRAAWRLGHDNPAAVYRRLEGEALDEMAEHFHAHNDYPKGIVHLAAQRLANGAVWEKTLDTDNGRKTAKKILGTAALIGGAAMMIVPGGGVVATGLMVVTSTAGVASVVLEVEDRIAKEGQLKLDRRLAMDVLQVVAISLPFGTLTRTFAEAALVGKGRFLLCMTGLDAAQGFIIAAEAKDQLAVIEASTAVQLAGATSDDQRKAIHAERDRRVAEVIGGAVVNGGFLLVSLGHGIKRAIAITRVGARFTVREPVRELVKQGRERMEQALSTDTFEHEGQRVQLTDEERRYLEHEIAAHDSAPQPKPAENTDSAAKPAAEHEQPAGVDPAKTTPQHETQPPAAGHPADTATTDATGDIEAALGKKMQPDEVKTLSADHGDHGLVELAQATGERFPELVADAGTATAITSVKRFGAQATAKLLKGLGGQGLRKLRVDIDELAIQLDAEGAHGSYRWGGTGKAERALSGGSACVHKSADPASGARTLDVETPAGPIKLDERGRYDDVRIDRSMLSPEDAQRLERLFADYGVTDEKAKQLVIEALENARLAKNTPDLAAAIKKVRPTLDEAKTNANRATESGKPTTTQEVILRSDGAPLAPAAEGPAVTEAKALIASGILEDRAFQSARTAPEGRDAVSQRLQALVAKDRAEQTHGKKGGRVLTRVEFKGDLFVDETSAARYVDSEGHATRDTDVAPDLDLAYVVEKDGSLQIEYVGSVKIVKGSSAASASTDAANQNRLGKAAVEAQGKRFPTTTRNGVDVWAEVKSVIGHDETGAELDLTGKLRWGLAAKTETIGSRGTRGFDANLPASKSELDEIVVAIWRLAELRKR